MCGVCNGKQVFREQGEFSNSITLESSGKHKTAESAATALTLRFRKEKREFSINKNMNNSRIATSAVMRIQNWAQKDKELALRERGVGAE